MCTHIQTFSFSISIDIYECAYNVHIPPPLNLLVTFIQLLPSLALSLRTLTLVNNWPCE